jgi:hypothetical protein
MPAATDDITPPSKQGLKSLFKKLCRSYIEHQRPPSDDDMAPLWNYSEYVNYEDIVSWKDEVGVRKGVIVDGGRVRFTEWPSRPHEMIVTEFNQQFSDQFSAIYRGTASYPVFVNTTTTGIYLLSRMNLTSEISSFPARDLISNRTRPGVRSTGPNSPISSSSNFLNSPTANHTHH